jgi:hypothetical protein
VPTADGVREPRNRRVEIEVPRPPAPPPAPPPAVAEPAPPPAERAPAAVAEREEPSRFAFTLGPVYGHNFQEQDEGDGTENDLLGAELTFDLLPGFLGGLSLKQGVFWGFNAVDEGVSGRSVLALNLAPDLGLVRPRLALNLGGVYGEGVQDGLVAGPEVGLDLNLPGGFTLRPKVAYDYQFRNRGWDEGILWGGLDLGFRF